MVIRIGLSPYYLCKKKLIMKQQIRFVNVLVLVLVLSPAGMC